MITYQLAAIYRPSKNAPGKFNVLNQAGEVQSVDPNGGISWKDNSTDGNYEQCTRDGVAQIYQPGGDQNPDAPFIVLLPTGN